MALKSNILQISKYLIFYWVRLFFPTVWTYKM